VKEFYVGYLPQAPPTIRRFARLIIGLLLFAAVGSAITITALQNPFAASVFEFGKTRTFAGTIEASPYPTLLVTRPGNASPPASRYLLVGKGKHGADPDVSAYDRRAVRLTGTLIFRGRQTLIEVEPGSLSEDKTAPSQPDAEVKDLGMFELVGEIVDSKCYSGVMKPGEGKVHRDCAVRCLSGGIPPVFAVANFEGAPATLMLTDHDRKLLPRTSLRLAAKPVRIRGHVVQIGDSLRLETDSASISELP
jgi:hypothetical protein